MEIPTLITEIRPKGMKVVQGPQSTYFSSRVLRYPAEIEIVTTSATPMTSNNLKVALRNGLLDPNNIDSIPKGMQFFSMLTKYIYINSLHCRFFHKNMIDFLYGQIVSLYS